MRGEIVAAQAATPPPRRLRVSLLLRHLGHVASAWYRPQRLCGPRRAPGPAPRAVADDVVEIIRLAATEWPW